ncbi:MAG TPA: hypothetical protein VF881_12360 [Polyangiaceae bacterium]
MSTPLLERARDGQDTPAEREPFLAGPAEDFGRGACLARLKLLRLAFVAMLFAPFALMALRVAQTHWPALTVWVTGIEPTPTLEPLATDGRSSAVILARMGRRTVAWVADDDASAIVAYDIDKARVLSRTPADGTPSQLVIGRDGRIYAALARAGRIRAYRPSDASGTLHPIMEAATAAEPVSLALTPDESMLVVACAWGQCVEVFRTATLERLRSIEVPREPRAVVVEQRGQRAFVAHAVGSILSVVELEEGSTRWIELRGGEGWAPNSHWQAFDFRPPALVLAGMTTPESPWGARITASPPRSKPAAVLVRGPRQAVQGYALAKIRVGGDDRLLLPVATTSTAKTASTSRTNSTLPR